MNIFNINRPYVRDSWSYYAPMYVPGENYSFYINFDSPVSDTRYSNFQLWVINANTGTQLFRIGGLRTLFVAGTYGYHLYIPNFVFPLGVPDGQCYFQIYCTGVGEMCRSNIIEVNSRCHDFTSIIEFAHNDQIYNYRFDLLQNPKFKFRMRLPINIINAPEISSVRDSYRQASGQRELRISKSFRDIKQTLEMYFASNEDFEAISAILEMSDVSINGMSLILLEQAKIEEIDIHSNLYKGTFVVIVKDKEIRTDKGNLDLIDTAFFGGNGNYLSTYGYLPR
jgi:hypothetical protein